MKWKDEHYIQTFIQPMDTPPILEKHYPSERAGRSRSKPIRNIGKEKTAF